MNGWEFMYFIGCGVSFIMTFVWASEENREMQEKDQCFGGVIFTGLTFSIFSWAVPVCWVGYEIYRRKFKKEQSDE